MVYGPLNDLISSRWFRIGVGGLSGLLYGLALPKIDIQWLAWVCLVPLFVPHALKRGGPLFLAGLSAGLVSATFRTYWIAQTLELYGGVPLPLGVFTTFLLIAYMALYSAIFLVLAGRFDLSWPLFPWAAASLWVLLEWVQSWMISGFPWALLGNTLYETAPVLQLASLTGVYGLSFLLVLVNGALAQILFLRRRPLVYGSGPLLVLVLVLLWGYYRLESRPNTDAPSLQVGIVQGNITQDQKWNNRKLAATQRYIELSRQLPPNLDLIVFPETALPIFFTDPHFQPYSQPVAELAQQWSTHVLVGSLEGRVAQPDTIYNRAYLLDQKGQLQGFSDKVHLVPFGEYLPFPWIFNYLGGLTAESGRFTHGQSFKKLQLGQEGPAFGVFICYESIFPAITRQLTQLGATFLINTTNDAWFGTTSAPHQHFSMAILRAVETGRPVIRAANTGISGLIGPTGNVLARTDLFTTTAIQVELQPQTQMTPYTRFGDVLLYAAVFFLVACILPYRRWRRAQSF